MSAPKIGTLWRIRERDELLLVLDSVMVKNDRGWTVQRDLCLNSNGQVEHRHIRLNQQILYIRV